MDRTPKPIVGAWDVVRARRGSVRGAVGVISPDTSQRDGVARRHVASIIQCV